MKISVDDQELFTLTETQKQVIKNDIPEEVFDEDMKRRLHYVLMHKYERCFERLKKEWEQKFKAKGVSMLPTDEEAFAKMVFSQSEYKSRSDRGLEIEQASNP